MRRSAAAIAGVLSSDGIADWIFDSLDLGEPADARFEDLLVRTEADMVAHIEPPVPPDTYREYVPVIHAMRHARARGLCPDFVIDVGASVGIWSWAVSKVFPAARFVLADPLASRYDPRGRAHYMGGIPRAESADVAISNASGRATLQVSPDLYGASLFLPRDFRTYVPVDVPVMTVDDLARERQLEGRGLLKADVQFAEHLVIEGARDLLPRLDAIVLELSLYRYHSEARTLLEMMLLLEKNGFRYFDDAGCWRSPVDGMLLQKDVLFVRNGLCEPPLGG
jgi:FkbM family methyltransferase